MSRYIDADKLESLCDIMAEKCDGVGEGIWNQFRTVVEWTPTAEVMTYTEIAEMLNDLFGDPCPCDYNGIDEWLPFECKFEECPQPGETRCWEEYLRHRG